jgi:hypothetical protein
MTANARCHYCEKITGHFQYNYPRLDPNNINDGQWLCSDHLPKSPAEQLENPTQAQLNGHLSRRERRALERKPKRF